MELPANKANRVSNRALTVEAQLSLYKVLEKVKGFLPEEVLVLEKALAALERVECTLPRSASLRREEAAKNDY